MTYASASGEVIETSHLLIEWAALGIEVLAVAVIVATVIILAVTRGTVRYLFRLGEAGAYESYKNQLGRGLLMGLDLLVAADLVRTVALESTLHNIAMLGLLVLVRTFLSWSLVVEIEGCWPWRVNTEARAQNASEQRGDRANAG
jgi:uncharacterized membrane protein